MTVFETSQPDATSLLVTGLRPYTQYTLRLIAENIAGRSAPSQPTRTFQTIQAPPSGAPPEVTVRAVNETAIRVRWKPLVPEFWNGEGKGYRIQYKPSTEPEFTRTQEVNNENANSYTFGGLEEWTEYNVRVAAFNKVGTSAYSDVATERTIESGECHKSQHDARLSERRKFLNLQHNKLQSLCRMCSHTSWCFQFRTKGRRT